MRFGILPFDQPEIFSSPLIRVEKTSRKNSSSKLSAADYEALGKYGVKLKLA